MRSLISSFLLLHSDAHLEETSLMQGLVARRGQLAPESTSRKDTTAKLMETATKMMKNGATPDVITFIETTITEVNRDVLGVIVEEHNEDQALIYEIIHRFEEAVVQMEECVDQINDQHADRSDASEDHQLCRSDEAVACARSRRCEDELEELWRIVTTEEAEMREIHWGIHDEWCVGPEPPHPGLDDPFNWEPGQHMEGPETSQSTIPYPQIIYEQGVIDFRMASIDFFGRYIVQLPRVQEAWTNYNAKLLECAAYEETWTLRMNDCDDLQTTLHDKACEHASTSRECASNFGHEYHMTLLTYNDAVAAIRQKEYDRKREWETLHIVTCLLETVYTHVIHSINSGEPCPTTESHPEQTAAEINTCHIVEESMTTNLTIIYPDPPPVPVLPPVVDPPCTAGYIWEESHFDAEIQTSHAGAITADNLGDWFTVLSAYGWAGCAAPKACIPCEADDLVVDPAYVTSDVCKAHQMHLSPGQQDWDSFRCLNGEQCITSDGRCNGTPQCDDGSDEQLCNTDWGTPAILGTEACKDPSSPDVQFTCTDGSGCVSVHARCNGINNCADGSDESGCPTTTVSVTLEAMSGYESTVVSPAVNSLVFTDRHYTFNSLGSFTGFSFVQMANDKQISHSHVQTKLRLQQPTAVYVVKLDDTELSWLEAEGWTLTHLEGVSYNGIRETRHTDWSGVIHDDHYGPGQVWVKTFPAGVVEMRGNGGGAGSYLIFLANTNHLPSPPVHSVPGEAEYIGCFVDDGARDLGNMRGNRGNSATNTFELCRIECGDSLYMGLQFGGECFCANSYSTAAQYEQRPDSECNMHHEPCSSNSFNCGDSWRNAIYRLSYTMVDGCLNQNHEVPRAVVSVNSDATASVRCCSMDGATCDSDHLPGGCQSDKTYEEAAEICAANGERLCTEAEIIDRVCCGTGCNFDGHQVWVSH